MGRNSKVDFVAREEFIRQAEKWRIDNDFSQAAMLERMGMSSSAGWSLWVKPKPPMLPKISTENMAKLTLITGIKYEGNVEIEMDRYLSQLEVLTKEGKIK